jgi:hypothetical protein
VPSHNCKGVDTVNSAKRKQLQQAARREARLNLATSVTGWSIIAGLAAFTLPIGYELLIVLMTI